MKDLVCLGEMLIDFIPGNEAGVYIRMPGGAPANVAVAAARNGLDVGFCGRLGCDDFGRFLLSVLQQHKVQILCPELVQNATTTMAFVTLDKNGDRSFTFARKPGADMYLTRSDVDLSGATRATMLHAGSFSLSEEPAADATRYALSKAYTDGKLVSFDVNYRNIVWNDDRKRCAAEVKKILPFVGFLKVSEEEADMLDMSLEKAALEYNIAVIVETLGANGARFFFHGKTFHIPGHQVACVDTTGAGDAFWGGFLSYLLHQGVVSTANLTERLVSDAVRYGNVAGSLCVQKRGAMESLPTIQEIQRML